MWRHREKTSIGKTKHSAHHAVAASKVALSASWSPLRPKNKYLLGAFAGIRAAVTGMILVTGCRMFRRTVKAPLECAAVFVFFVLAVLKLVSPALLILAAIPLGLAYVWWQSRRLKNAAESAQTTSDSTASESVQPTENGGAGK